MLALGTAHDVMESMLSRLYSAEQRSLEAIEPMADRVESSQLRDALCEQRRHTVRRRNRLEQIFEHASVAEPRPLVNPAVEAVVRRTKKKLQSAQDPKALDADLINDAQKLEDLQVAGYQAAAEFARASGETHIAELLAQTVREEAHLERKLTVLARTVGDACNHQQDVRDYAGSIAS